MSTPININLDGTTTVNFLNHRLGNARTFEFTISIDATPIVAADYSFTMVFYFDGKTVLTIPNDEWDKTGATISRSFNALPLTNIGTHYYDLTWTDNSGQVVTVLPGTLQVIPRHG